jgi:hypothetical protein
MKKDGKLNPAVLVVIGKTEPSLVDQSIRQVSDTLVSTIKWAAVGLGLLIVFVLLCILFTV